MTSKDQAVSENQALPVIVTERLTLRGRTPDDAEALFPAMSDPGIMTWWSRAPFADPRELREDFGLEKAGSWRTWAILETGSRHAIGFVSAGSKRQGVSEVGYLLSREAQGRGIGREAVAAVIGQLFAEGQRRVFADTDPDNRGSIALLESLGFRLEGHLRGEWHTHIGIRDSLIFGLLASEWGG
ncbi:GNAT family N-acetyltransferase [Novosphingobium sp.]|uniref:GNAT family N-acetyltransferase n=1 Tax=Novosphingobium sp. TaxID=1874826 RepID=UPI003D6D5CBD